MRKIVKILLTILERNGRLSPMKIRKPRWIRATAEISEDEVHFRVIPFYISEISEAEGKRILSEVAKQLKGDEFVYQICAPCIVSSLDQPFYDYFNGFSLLQADFWKNRGLFLTLLVNPVRLFRKIKNRMIPSPAY
jgi:hypothetical protein